MGCDPNLCPRTCAIQLAYDANEDLRAKGVRSASEAVAKRIELETENSMIISIASRCEGILDGWCGQNALVNAGLQRTFTLPPQALVIEAEHHDVGFRASKREGN